jgi:hypothetical protein
MNEADYRPAYPMTGSITITKSDSTVLGTICRGLWVGGVGDVAVRMLDGSTPTFTAVPAGTLLNIQFDKVLSTGTSASLMVGLYG